MKLHCINADADDTLCYNKYEKGVKIMKVIYHVDENEKWQLCLGNVRNMLKYGEENKTTFEIEILANSIAVEKLKKESEWEQQINELLENGVVIAACQNALNAQKIIKEDLIEQITIVPAGVVELVIRQNEGFAYIKP